MVNMAVEVQHLSSRTGEVQPEPNKMTSSWLLLCMFLTKLSETP